MQHREKERGESEREGNKFFFFLENKLQTFFPRIVSESKQATTAVKKRFLGRFVEE